MTVFLYAIAVFGFLLFIVGRRLIIREAREISIGWVWAIRFLPLADVMFLARYWELGKSGAAMAIVGMLMMAPLGIVSLYEARTNFKHKVHSHRVAMDRIDEASLEFGEADRQEIMQAKEEKLRVLTGKMMTWYLSLQQRRAALPTDSPEQITAFNDEAAAYQNLNSVSREEAAELESMKAGS